MDLYESKVLLYGRGQVIARSPWSIHSSYNFIGGKNRSTSQNEHKSFTNVFPQNTLSFMTSTLLIKSKFYSGWELEGGASCNIHDPRGKGVESGRVNLWNWPNLVSSA